MSGILLHHLLGPDADRPGGDDELAGLVAVLGDHLVEDEPPAAPALLLPRLAGLDGGGQHVAGAQRSVVGEVLLGVQAGPAAAAAATAAAAAGLRARRLAARPEPRLPDGGPQRI